MFFRTVKSLDCERAREVTQASGKTASLFHVNVKCF